MRAAISRNFFFRERVRNGERKTPEECAPDSSLSLAVLFVSLFLDSAKGPSGKDGALNLKPALQSSALGKHQNLVGNLDETLSRSPSLRCCGFYCFSGTGRLLLLLFSWLLLLEFSSSQVYATTDEKSHGDAFVSGL